MARGAVQYVIIAGVIVSVTVLFYQVSRNCSIAPEWFDQAMERTIDAVKDPIPNPDPDRDPPWAFPMQKYDYQNVPQTDPILIEYIRQVILKPPSVLPYNLTEPKRVDYSEASQSTYADKNYFHGMRDGFFIEAGAVNGELASTTLYMEKELGWTGLLIEPIPYTYAELLTKHRKAYSANVALAPTQKASLQKLRLLGPSGVSSDLNTEGIPVKAIPLYSLLLALDVKIVDFLSLDIQSFELKVLKTIPWDKVKFRLMCIEANLIPEGKKTMQNFLVSKGYKYLGYKNVDMWFGMMDLLAPLKKSKQG